MTRQRGSVLMLVPAGFLVVLVLGAIAVDLSLLFLRQRQASSTAVHLANDLATLALDEGHLRATGEYVLDERRAVEVVPTLLAATDVADEVVDVDVTVVGEDAVAVEVTLRAEYVFARAVPGAAEGAEVTARATARAAAG